MKRYGLVLGLTCLLVQAGAQSKAKHEIPAARCQQVSFEGSVKAGQGFEKVFASGFRFYLEPLSSGWIVRVLATDAARGPHDYAELATPPYKSVSPLLISTDWAFRSQDAIAWNPRHFRYTASAVAFRKLEGLYNGVMANNPQAAGMAAQIVSSQPEAELRILDARIVPGMADQGRMAAMVAQNLSQTPHSVDSSQNPTPLGRLEEIHFRVILTLPAAIGQWNQKNACRLPTT